MMPVYKMVKVRMPHCPKCKQQLSGNNSYADPYSCKCGVWHKPWLEPEFIVYPEDLI